MIDITTWVCIIILTITFLGLALFIINELKYKHKVIIREQINDRRIILIDKAKDFIEEGTTYWLLKKQKKGIKKKMPLPPIEAIEITNKGKKYVEAYRDEDGNYIFITDKNKDNLKSLQPLTRNDRLTMIQSYKTAEVKFQKDMSEQVQKWIITGGLITILALALIFAPDIITTFTKGSEQVSSSLNAYEKIRHENALDELKEIEKITAGIQTIHNTQQEQDKRIIELEEGTP